MSKRKPLTRREQREVDILLTGNHVYGQCWAARTLFREVVRLRASLAAAEAKLADSERACAGFVKMAADEMYRADAMAHALDQSPYMRARVKAQYVAARRAAEAANG